MHSRIAPSPGSIGCAVLWLTLAAAAVESPEVLTRPVRVLVTNEAGQPLQGVKIHRSVWTDERFPPNADYTTNEKGETIFAVPHEVSILRLWAAKQGHVPLFANFTADKPGVDPVPLEYTFCLEKGTTIGGFVRDESGFPIAGAKVEVCIDSRNSIVNGEALVDRWLACGSDSRITDRRGYWSLDNVPPGDAWKIGLRLHHPEHVDDVNWRGLGNLVPPFTLEELRNQTAACVMEKGVKVTGTLKDPAGKGVAGALVIWGDRAYHNESSQETLTDKDGRYQLPPLSPGFNTLTIVAVGFSPELESIRLDSPNHVADFQLRTGKTVQFDIVDVEGQPIPGVGVNVAGWRRMESLFNWRHSNVPYSKIPDKADAKGHYEWTWAPEDEVSYFFSKKGYKSSEGLTFGPGTHRVTLHKAKTP